MNVQLLLLLFVVDDVEKDKKREKKYTKVSQKLCKSLRILSIVELVFYLSFAWQ